MEFDKELAEKRLSRGLAITPSCWIWMRNHNGRGYGKIKVDKIEYYTHRLSYLIHFGNIPDGMFVCHRCDNPKCANPDHLFLGSPKDNMSDMIKKGRQAPGHVKSNPGIKNGRAVLTEEQVTEIRVAASKKKFYGIKFLASKFSVSEVLIDKIVRGLLWRHVPMVPKEWKSRS